MPRRLTLGTLRTRMKQRAGMEFNESILSPEWDSMASEVYGDLFSIVVDAGDEYFQTTYTITADDSASYDEPDDHLTTIAFDRITDAAGNRSPLFQILSKDRHLYAGRTGDAVGWALVDDQIVLYPKPSSGTYELIYTPQSPDLSSYVDGDELDLVNVYGEMFVLHGVAAIALNKSESDVRFHMDRQARAGQKLLEWAAQRALPNPRDTGGGGGGPDGYPGDPEDWT